MSNTYTEPVSELLTLGRPWRERNEIDYIAMGINKEHIPDLINMALGYNIDISEESDEPYGQIHAWRALGQLKAEEAIVPLLHLFEADWDWAWEEMPDMYGAIGPIAIPALYNYLKNVVYNNIAGISVVSAFEHIMKSHPESIPECTNLLTAQLENFKENHPTVNGYFVLALCNFKVIEAAPLIREAFETDFVDIDVMGDWEDAQVKLGLLEKRITPRPKSVLHQRFSKALYALDLPDPKQKNKDEQKKKEANKKKMVKQSKKKNRKK